MKPVAPLPAARPATKARSERERLLAEIYGPDVADRMAPSVEDVLAGHEARRAEAPTELWTERDVWCITYPDQFQRPGIAPLSTLAAFLDTHLVGLINGVHVLPFFPSTSDEGFAIADHDAVDPRLGSWEDIEAISSRWRLMVDAVVNHASVQGRWFEAWRSGDPAFSDFFRTADPDVDLSRVVRARRHPLLTAFDTAAGQRWVWTTFSADQADLDYRNPEVLIRVLEVVLGYAAHGADVIRLDAVGFLWKEEASPSIHLPQTHRIIQFLRACLGTCYPGVVVITETNVPHEENLSYLGAAGVKEAHAVYQFPLPPLTLHAFATQDATRLAAWLDALEEPRQGTSYLNFLSSHDGVGLRPLEGLIDPADVDLLTAQAEGNGGLVSLRAAAKGTTAPYELNATWFDLIRGPTTGEDALARHLASHAVMLAARGIPALYVQSLLAAENDTAGAATTGRARAINRRRFVDIDALEAELGDPASRAARSLTALGQMIDLRTASRAFHPDARQAILDTPPAVLGIARSSSSGPASAAGARVYVNVAGHPVKIVGEKGPVRGGHRWRADGGTLELGPWGNAWILE